ncbi:DUF3617 domain-containing protein [Variovorax terrae]|uniref:DUF3617 domain-containing protein n=1 Tax=Variovorax terrae TaxID=2923278 RepID=A0A9X2AQ62_9BURK|nr:DUF3617 family protein [Variovorax terrae]MCJ0765650.1 DUF3617 domain-containing protein [Variovorax terrae]
MHPPTFAGRVFAAAVALAAPLCAQADSFNAKPGAWETTTVIVTTGNPMPDAMLAKMPASMRARYEQSMAARSGKPSTGVSKVCLTAKDFDQNRWLKMEDEDDKEDNCAKKTDKVIFKSASKLTLERVCSASYVQTALMTVEAQGPERIVSSVDITNAGSRGKVHMDTASRWLGASCAGIQ